MSSQEHSSDAHVWVRRQASPRASNAERYLLMRKLTVTEPNADTLELCFDATGTEGAVRLAHNGAKRPKAAKHLQLVSIYPCSATELKASCHCSLELQTHCHVLASHSNVYWCSNLL
jgi:hypothetical protein